MARSSSYGIAAAAALLIAGALARNAGAEPLSSPTWGFTIDLPEGYALTEGDGKSRFSFFEEAGKSTVTLVVYAPGRYAAPEALLADTAKRLTAISDVGGFEYRGKQAALAQLSFTGPTGPAEGWALAVELAPAGDGGKPLLLALAYGPQGAAGNEERELSALDSICPTEADKRAPGPVTAFSYPSGGRRAVRLPFMGKEIEAIVDAADGEAAKALVDREFRLLVAYSKSPLWQEAWKRFYRAIWRDSYERLAGVSFAVERAVAERAAAERKPADQRTLAEGALAWVQAFKYERDLMGSDFVDLSTAALEQRGDCDSRALLAAVILQHANVDAILMVSREYGHAMAGADVAGAGARFKAGKVDYVVAETTAKVALGMIGQNVADPAKWLAVDFPYLPPADRARD